MWPQTFPRNHLQTGSPTGSPACQTDICKHLHLFASGLSSGSHHRVSPSPALSILLILLTCSILSHLIRQEFRRSRAPQRASRHLLCEPHAKTQLLPKFARVSQIGSQDQMPPLFPMTEPCGAGKRNRLMLTLPYISANSTGNTSIGWTFAQGRAMILSKMQQKVEFATRMT